MSKQSSPQNLDDLQQRIAADLRGWLERLVNEFSKETDRAAVIISASMLENMLEELIRSKLVASVAQDDPLFEGPIAPLGSFSAKIEMAYRLGLISPQFARDLHIVRKIRNDFAHNITECTFDGASTRSRVDELVRSWRNLPSEIPRELLPPGIRYDFLYVVGWMLAMIRAKVFGLKPLPSRPPEPGYNADGSAATGASPEEGAPESIQ